jgi:hypothetical protein
VIGEQYAKGSVVIINNERTRYSWKRLGGGPLSSRDFGKPIDQGEGVQTISGKRDNPTWYPSEDIQWGRCSRSPAGAAKPAWLT